MQWVSSKVERPTKEYHKKVTTLVIRTVGVGVYRYVAIDWRGFSQGSVIDIAGGHYEWLKMSDEELTPPKPKTKTTKDDYNYLINREEDARQGLRNLVELLTGRFEID